MIRPNIPRHKSRVITLTAWQAVAIILLAMNIALGAIAYAHIAGLRAQLIELKNMEVICPKSNTGRVRVAAELTPSRY